MLRRVCLKLVLSAASLAFLTRDWLGSVAQAQGPSMKRPAPFRAVPTTVAEAIQSNNRETVLAFVLANPGPAAAASVKDKARMLTLLQVCATCDAGIWRQRGLSVSADHERATLILARGMDRNPKAFAELIDAIGGRKYVEAELPKLRSAELKSLSQRSLLP
jgi:hypothetical protein